MQHVVIPCRTDLFAELGPRRLIVSSSSEDRIAALPRAGEVGHEFGGHGLAVAVARDRVLGPRPVVRWPAGELGYAIGLRGLRVLELLEVGDRLGVPLRSNDTGLPRSGLGIGGSPVSPSVARSNPCVCANFALCACVRRALCSTLALLSRFVRRDMGTSIHTLTRADFRSSVNVCAVLAGGAAPAARCRATRSRFPRRLSVRFGGALVGPLAYGKRGAGVGGGQGCAGEQDGVCHGALVPERVHSPARLSVRFRLAPPLAWGQETGARRMSKRANPFGKILDDGIEAIVSRLRDVVVEQVTVAVRGIHGEKSLASPAQKAARTRSSSKRPARVVKKVTRGNAAKMRCRHEGCKNRSRGPRFHYLCKEHGK